MRIKLTLSSSENVQMEWFCFNSSSSSTSRCSWVRRCVKKRGKESATPLPLGKVFVVLTVQFGNVFGKCSSVLGTCSMLLFASYLK